MAKSDAFYQAAGADAGGTRATPSLRAKEVVSGGSLIVDVARLFRSDPAKCLVVTSYIYVSNIAHPTDPQATPPGGSSGVRELAVAHSRHADTIGFFGHKRLHRSITLRSEPDDGPKKGLILVGRKRP